ncbi:polysaccharide biosynthesis tyrosine autokinase [Planctomycetota bacterium]|nr:polysaccharide biosynthesis tyrosine autokinase [Planctomycetota bacterium]
MNAVINNNSSNVPTNAANPLGNKFKPVDPVKLLRQYLWLLIPVCLLSPIIGGGVWFTWMTVKPKWTSQQMFEVQAGGGDVRDTNINPFTGSQINIVEAYMKTQAMRMKSEQIFSSALNSRDIKQTKWYQSFNENRPKMIESLEEDVINAFVPRDSLYIAMLANTKDKDDSRIILAAVRDAYLRSIRSSNENNQLESEAAFVEELKLANQTIDRLNKNIKAYAIDESLVIKRQSTADLEIKNYTEQIVQLESGLAMMKKSYDLLISQQLTGDYSPEDKSTVEQDPLILGLTQQANYLESDLKAHLQMYPKNHQTSRYKQHQYDEMLAKLNIERDQKLRELQDASISATSNQIETLQNQLAELRPMLEAAEKKLADLSANIQIYENLLTERDTENANKELTKQALSNLRLAKSRKDLNRIDAVGDVTEPEMTSPKLLVVVPGVTFLLVGLTVGLIFLKEMLDQHVKSPGDVKLIANAELLSVIPNSTEDKKSNAAVERIVSTQPTSLLAESYRQTRTNILRKMERSGYKSLMIVATQPGSGASVNTHNIACSLSANGKNVVILDANIRKASQHILCDTNCDLGWTDILTGHADISTAIVDGQAGDPSLLALGSGNIKPEMLESKAFRKLITDLEARYDYVIIDAPPLLLTSESQILCKYVDAVAIVVHASQDKRGMVERLQNKVRGNRAELLGIILNAVESSVGGYFKKNYEAFHRYSSDSQTSNVSRAAAVTAMQDQTDNNA